MSVTKDCLTVRQLFENRIVLRDLFPTDQSLPNIDTLRESLGLAADYVPRKNEASYAKIVAAVADKLTDGRAKYLFYTGDSVFNDGSAIRHLVEQGPYETLGFLCNEIPGELLGEFLFHRIIFSDCWGRLWKLFAEGRKRGFELGPSTVAIFDLDNTVYAAKSRNSEPLKRARLRSVENLLLEILGEPIFNLDLVRLLYREFDRDEWHPLTGDNQDHVVFLTLICAIGLQQPQVIRRSYVEHQGSMLSLIASARAQLKVRKDYDRSLERAFEVVEAVYHNTMAYDPSPFKAFRYREHASTLEGMTAPHHSPGKQDLGDAIVMTREIVDCVHFLRERGCRVIAFSDRPRESTEPFGLPDSSLLDVELLVSGTSIASELSGLDL